MGCALSSKRREALSPSSTVNSNDAVSLCRERKRIVKKAVKLRLAFADAHSAYFHSLSAVSSAVSGFSSAVSSSSSSSSSSPHFLITFPSEQVQETLLCHHFYDDDDDDDNDESTKLNKEVEWDFFNLLDTTTTSTTTKENGGEMKLVEEGHNGHLNEALKDLEDHFMRAYENGFHVSNMLELNYTSLHHQPLRKCSTKKSISSQSSSCKSLLSPSSRTSSSTMAASKSDSKSLLSSTSENSSTRTESRTDVTDDFCGMASGSHSFTLGRLYAWEKKLYHEVKAGEQTQKMYKQKSSRLRRKDLEGDDSCRPSKATSEVNDLYHRLLVAFQRAEAISRQIEKLRDEELQPQLVELLQGLMRTSNAMLETHEIQNKITREIKYISLPDDRKLCNGSHRLAAFQLEAAIQNWQSCFSDYVSAQKAYVKSLHGWLSKFVDAEAQYYYKDSYSLPPIRFNGPTLMVLCQNWLTSLERLPDKAVKHAMKSLAKGIQALWAQQGEEQQQKRKVDGLSKEMDRKILAFKRAEDKALTTKQIAQSNVKDQVESLDEKKIQLDMFGRKIEVEKERYLCSMQETERVTINGFQMGFSSVFESLADFYRASGRVYADLVTFSQNAKV